MLDGIPLVNLTPSVLLGIVVLFILTGRLVPLRYLKEKIEEAEKWRAAYELERQARAAAEAQSAELLEVGKATYAILDAALSYDDPPGRGGAHRVVQTSR